MSIPTRGECLDLMSQAGMPPHIKKHSLMVAEIALFLGKRLRQKGIRLSIPLLEAGGLLHDIAKVQSLSCGGSHEKLGAKFLHERGYMQLASIVQDHVTLDLIRLNGPITESLVVNYADKRVKHDQIVTLQERFTDLIERYAKSPENAARLEQKYHQYSTLEQRIFGCLAIEPEANELMQLSADIAGEDGGQDHEWRQNKSRVACRGEIR